MKYYNNIFRVGSVVKRIYNGRIKMTIASIEGKYIETVWCSMFNGVYTKFKKRIFLKKELKLIDN